MTTAASHLKERRSSHHHVDTVLLHHKRLRIECPLACGHLVNRNDTEKISMALALRMTRSIEEKLPFFLRHVRVSPTTHGTYCCFLLLFASCHQCQRWSSDHCSTHATAAPVKSFPRSRICPFGCLVTTVVFGIRVFCSGHIGHQ